MMADERPAWVRPIWRDPVLEGMTVAEQVAWGGRRAAKSLMRAAKDAVAGDGGPEVMCRLLEKAADHWEMSGHPWRGEVCRAWVAAFRRGG